MNIENEYVFFEIWKSENSEWIEFPNNVEARGDKMESIWTWFNYDLKKTTPSH